MPRPKGSSGPGKKERYEILFEEVSSKIDLVLDGLKGLTEQTERLEQRVGALEQRMERIELRVGALEQRMERLEVAISTHTKEIQQLQADVHVLTERFEEHLKAHAA
ncbi:MAG: hypothetical protein HYZ90_07365 [Candidatus Omnitrophica bacterium]|nr:hypothetical protein [Candidatus Omnitrophota bacterium]